MGAGLNGFDGTVNALAVSATALYVGGGFTSYRGVAGSASRLAKLNPDTGTIDGAFSPAGATANGFDGEVRALAASCSEVFVGGAFTAYKGVANSARGLAKLGLDDGAIDAVFSPPGATSNGFENGRAVFALALAGSSVYAGGNFNRYRNVAVSARSVAKIDGTTGILDPTFSPPAGNGFDQLSVTPGVHALAVAGTSLYAGGAFTAYRGVAQSANDIAKLDLATGAIDKVFSPPGATANGFKVVLNNNTSTGVVYALAARGGTLFAGGNLRFYRAANNAPNVASLDLATGAVP